MKVLCNFITYGLALQQFAYPVTVNQVSCCCNNKRTQKKEPSFFPERGDDSNFKRGYFFAPGAFAVACPYFENIMATGQVGIIYKIPVAGICPVFVKPLQHISILYRVACKNGSSKLNRKIILKVAE